MRSCVGGDYNVGTIRVRVRGCGCLRDYARGRGGLAANRVSNFHRMSYAFGGACDELRRQQRCEVRMLLPSGWGGRGEKRGRRRADIGAAWRGATDFAISTRKAEFIIGRPFRAHRGLFAVSANFGVEVSPALVFALQANWCEDGKHGRVLGAVKI